MTGLDADLVLRRANVITVDARDTRAQAVAVRDGRILGVGRDADLDGLIGARTRVLDLPECTVVPGFIDSHTHNVHVGEFRYSFGQLNLPAGLVPTIPLLLEQVRGRAVQARAGEWIGGRNFDPNGMRERRWPTRQELDAAAPANPVIFHPWFWGDQHIREFIGKERAARMVPARTAIDLGMAPCAHSDCPVCTPDDPVWPSNPLWAMACAVTRRTRSGEDIGPAERVTALEALRMYTLNGARAAFEEGIKGSLEVGKLADLVVLGADPLATEPWAIKDIPVEMTLIGGEVVFDRTTDRATP